MEVVEGVSLFDFWRVEGYVICIPINLCVDMSGNAVMGAGLALEMKKRAPAIASELGRKITAHKEDEAFVLDDDWVRGLPTKVHYNDATASLGLITQSLLWVRAEALGFSNRTFCIPKLGCGCGKLKWSDVEPLTVDLPSNVWLVTQ